MQVAFSIDELKAGRVWYDASSGKLFIQSQDFINGIDFSSLPNHDFESSEPVCRFSLGQDGSVVVCHHVDGRETWLPADMWVPGGCTPVQKK